MATRRPTSTSTTTTTTTTTTTGPSSSAKSTPHSNPTQPPTTVIKRLQSELLNLMLSPPPHITAFPSPTDLTLWTATLVGPTETPYANLSFKLSLKFPTNYPYAPPEVRFLTPVYHPNVDMRGRICLDILKSGSGSGSGEGEGGAWSAVLNVGSVLVSLQSLLGEPNNASPLNGEAALLWDSDQEAYKRKVLARHVEPGDLDLGEGGAAGA